MLLNGAPGSGKSTLAAALAAETAMTLALDIDVLKHSLGQWRTDATAAGLHARRLAVALVREHLDAGYDVVIGQYAVDTRFLQALEDLASRCGARYVEIVLELGAEALAARLASRSTSPSRPEHEVNNELVGPHEAGALVRSLEQLRTTRSAAVWLDAQGTLAETLDAVRSAVR